MNKEAIREVGIIPIFTIDYSITIDFPPTQKITSD